MSEIDHYRPGGLSEQMQWAEALAHSDLVPSAYKGRPANVLLAMGLGADMGLNPSQSLLRINVIQGKPTMSGELILDRVRKAGHRVRFIKEPGAVTCVIVRADDPDWEHRETFTMEDAKALGLTSKANYKSQPQTMLKWRALTACAREACPDALYGVVYTHEEIADTRHHSAPAGNAGNAPRISRESFTNAGQDARQETGAQQGAEAEAVVAEEMASPGQLERLDSLFVAKGIDGVERQVAGVNETLRLRGTPGELRDIEDMSPAQADYVIQALERLPNKGQDEPTNDEAEPLPLGE